MKKLFILVVSCLLLSNVIYTNIIFPQPIFAKNMDVIEESILDLESDKEQEFIVYDENGNFLFAQEDVTIEDQFIDKDYNVYEVYLVDNEYRIAYAKKISTIKMPKIKKIGVFLFLIMWYYALLCSICYQILLPNNINKKRVVFLPPKF